MTIVVTKADQFRWRLSQSPFHAGVHSSAVALTKGELLTPEAAQNAATIEESL
jgi:hypothetical protein